MRTFKYLTICLFLLLSTTSIAQIGKGPIGGGGGSTGAGVTDGDKGGVTVSGLGTIWTVDNDSHSHTSATISGIDISADTNLSGNTEVVLTGDALSLGAGVTRDTEWDTAAEINAATTDNDFVIIGGALGTPLSGTLTNAIGLPIATGISGLGTGVATALAVNVGTAGAFLPNNADATGLGAVTSSGTITSSGTFDVTGATAMVLGSADVTGVRIVTDGGTVTVPEGTITLETTTSDISPDRLTNDDSDNGLVDQDIIEGMGASATPGILLADSDASATGTATLSVDAYTASQDSILQVRVDDSAGEDTVYMEVDGVAEDVEIKKMLVPEGGLLFDEVAGATSISLTAAQVSRTMVTNYGQAAADITLELPTAAEGYSVIFMCGTAQGANYWRITTKTTADVLYANVGAGLVSGEDYIQTATPTVGWSCSCSTFRTGEATWSWMCGVTNGTWTTGNVD